MQNIFESLQPYLRFLLYQNEKMFRDNYIYFLIISIALWSNWLPKITTFHAKSIESTKRNNFNKHLKMYLKKN